MNPPRLITLCRRHWEYYDIESELQEQAERHPETSFEVTYNLYYANESNRLSHLISCCDGCTKLRITRSGSPAERQAFMARLEREEHESKPLLHLW